LRNTLTGKENSKRLAVRTKKEKALETGVEKGIAKQTKESTVKK